MNPITEARAIRDEFARQHGVTVADLISRDRHEPIASIRLNAIRETWLRIRGRNRQWIVARLFKRSKDAVRYSTRRGPVEPLYVLKRHQRQELKSAQPRIETHLCDCGRKAVIKVGSDWVCARCRMLDGRGDVRV